MQERQGTIRNATLRSMGSVVFIAALVIVLRGGGMREVSDALGRVEWRYALLGLAVMCVSRFAIAGRWCLLLRALEVGIPVRQVVSLTFTGLFAANFLPSTVGGDVARLACAVNMGYDGPRSAVSLFLDRAVGLAGFMLILLLALPVLGMQFPALQEEGKALLASAGSLCAWRMDKTGAMRRLQGFLGQAAAAIRLGMGRPWLLTGALGLTFIHMLCFFCAIWLTIEGVGESMGFVTIAVLWSLVYVATLVPLSLNGLGLQEASIAYVFTHAESMVADAGSISLGAAVAVAALMRTFIVVTSLPGIAFAQQFAAAQRSRRRV